MSNDNCRFIRPRAGTGVPRLSRRLDVRISSASTVDGFRTRSWKDRGMSLIRILSKSVPRRREWFRANSTCLGRQIAVRIFGKLLAKDQDAVERRQSAVRATLLARNSDLYFEVSESSVALFFQRAARACSISWFLRSTSTLRSASC